MIARRIQKVLSSKVIQRILFYILYTVFALLCLNAFPGGACGPGRGTISFFLLFPISAIFFLADFIRFCHKRTKEYGYAVLVHPLYWIIMYGYITFIYFAEMSII